jgi:hypothetical protein
LLRPAAFWIKTFCDVTYQLLWYDFKREFTVKPGQDLDLPAINDPS